MPSRGPVQEASAVNGRVALVTGAAGGIGREHALELAAQGASVVVSDIADPGAVVTEIEQRGGRAVGVRGDVSDEADAQAMVDAAIAHFGDLHAVVNNAGNLRGRMLVNHSAEDWDSVVQVHLRGTFLLTRSAARHWRARGKAGAEVTGRIVNTTSPAGLYGGTGYAAYGVAKAGIAALTVIAATELGRYGVTVNALSPFARTRMTAALWDENAHVPTGFDENDPANPAPLVAWLCSAESKVSGRVFTVQGGRIVVNDGWREGPGLDLGRRWTVTDVATELPRLVAESPAPMPLFDMEVRAV